MCVGRALKNRRCASWADICRCRAATVSRSSGVSGRTCGHAILQSPWSTSVAEAETLTPAIDAARVPGTSPMRLPPHAHRLTPMRDGAMTPSFHAVSTMGSRVDGPSLPFRRTANRRVWVRHGGRALLAEQDQGPYARLSTSVAPPCAADSHSVVRGSGVGTEIGCAAGAGRLLRTRTVGTGR